MILALYLPVALGGMLIYGDAVAPNIALTLGESWLVDVANLFMACHLILAFLIVTNPVSQELEHIFNVPHGLSLLFTNKFLQVVQLVQIFLLLLIALLFKT